MQLMEHLEFISDITGNPTCSICEFRSILMYLDNNVTLEIDEALKIFENINTAYHVPYGNYFKLGKKPVYRDSLPQYYKNIPPSCIRGCEVKHLLKQDGCIPRYKLWVCDVDEVWGFLQSNHNDNERLIECTCFQDLLLKAAKYQEFVLSV